MATNSDTTRLDAASRPTGSSRATRRLRREGRIPGVLYGRDLAPVPFAVDARELRHALARAGAVVELAVDGQATPAVVKDTQRHPVRNEITHIDLLRVDLNKPITATVAIELTGTDEAPGVVEGGILSQVTREVDVEALPADIPESIVFDASALELNATVTLDQLTAPAGVTLQLDETAAEITLVTITPPSTEEDGDGIEVETEVVGEVEPGAEDAGSGGEGEGSDAAETPEA